MNPGEIASTIRADLIEYKAGKRNKWRPKSNSASLLGHPCSLETGRYLYVRRSTQIERISLPPVDKQFLFDDGNAIEEQVLADLRASGHQVDRTQASFDWDQYQISGKIDGFIYIGREAYPIEIKAMSPWMFRDAARAANNGTLTAAGIRAIHNDWMFKYAAQLNTYLLMTGKELGVFAFKDRDSGDIQIYGYPLDYELGETCLKRAEAVNAALAGTAPPPPHCSRPDICSRCEVCHICEPPQIQYGTAMEIMDSPDLEAKLARLQELEPAHREWTRLDTQVKNTVTGRQGICGDYEVSGEWKETPAKTVPEHTEPPKKTWYRKITKWRKDQ